MCFYNRCVFICKTFFFFEHISFTKMP
jgi:hypothetical protein